MRHDDAYEVTWLVRRLFRAMTDLANGYLQDSGLSAADRAVMEFLYPDQSLTVPDIARRYQVTRQHVQATANGLLQSGLLRSEDNPRHKRSQLLRLSYLGREAFAEIRANESRLIDQWFSQIEGSDVVTTRRTLATLLDILNKETHYA